MKSLTISRGDGTVIRELCFRPGMNLIVDETPNLTGKETGNNVGKTTVLKLIDFCLGGSPKHIYADPENKRNEYKLVKDYLVQQEVVVLLVLKKDLLDESSEELLIERNFLARKAKMQRVNGEEKTDEEFDQALTDLLFPGHYGSKPTFRQIIAHNIRYKDLSLTHTLKNLDGFTRDAEYETLYLFLLGCQFDHGDAKQELRTKIDLEERFQRRLQSLQTKSAYESALGIIETEISELEKKKSLLGLNPEFESDLNRLNRAKYNVNVASSEIGKLELRRQLILDAQNEIQSGRSSADVQQLRLLYEQATTLVTGIQRTFEELHEFHNSMIESKVRFITQDLPKVESELAAKRALLQQLLEEEARLSRAVVQTDSFATLEQLMDELNAKYQNKGEYENVIRQLDEVEATLTQLKKDLDGIDDALFSTDYADGVQEQVDKFNRYFASVSFDLYGEKYALKVDTKAVKGRRLYEFVSFNTNFSSGKKQGEITCFDIAYTLFADHEGIPCMHFLLNDKKELMHDNQLVKIADYVNGKGIQFVASMLKDKLPAALNRDEYVVVKLSQEDKLLRIEKVG